MSWIIFALLAGLFWAIVNVLNKFVLSKWTFNYNFLLAVFSIVSLITSIVIFMFQGFTPITVVPLIIALGTGILYFLTILFYYKALDMDEVSRVIPLLNLTPVFVAILAGFLLGEILTLSKYTGIFLVVAGAVLISTNKIGKIRSGKGLWYIALTTVSAAIVHTLTKYLLSFADYWTVFAYIRIGTFLAGVPILLFRSGDVTEHIRQYGNKLIAMVSLFNVINLLGVLFFTIAAVDGLVSLVNTLASTQSLFVLAFTVILSLFYPHILKEEIDKKNLVRKIASIVFMLIGVALVTG